MNDTKVSKFISLILRHKPEEIGLKLDKYGYIKVDDLLKCMINKGYNITIDDLNRIVVEDDKQRYSYSDDGMYIRANQGHSIEVDLSLENKEPPKYLYHGTTTRFLDSIMDKGICKMSRQYVHLSEDIETATKVGLRHGELVILKVSAKEMYGNGFDFYLSKNGVWLTDEVPVGFFEVNKEGKSK